MPYNIDFILLHKNKIQNNSKVT